MNKKMQKGIVAAVAASLGTGIVAPVYAASAETTDLASKYAKAYEATVNAKTQKELTAARTLVDALYAEVKGTANEYLATTLSSLLDPLQQKELVKLDNAIKAAEASATQANVNAARALIVDMPEVWRNAFSSYIDTIQNKLIASAVEAATKAQASGLQADLDAAKKLYDELLTVTNNDGVKSWVETALKAELDKVDVSLKVTSVKALKVNKLEVKFNKAADTTDVTLALTKGTSAVENSVEWSADKTSAVITTTAKMTNGVYSVAAKSAANATSSTGTVEIKSQYVAQIKLLNDVALTGKGAIDSDRAYVYYDVLDQYGESLRTSTNIEWSFSAEKVSDNRTTGMLTVKRSDDRAFTYGEKVYVTGVYTKTGVTVTDTVEVGAKQALNSVEVAGFVKKGTSEIVKTLPSGFKADTYYMVYSVKDQNGNSMVADKPVTNNDVTFVSDNVLLVKELNGTNETTLTINGEEYNAVVVTPGINVGKGGEVNITAIANKTGYKSELNTVIGEDQILTSFAMSAPTVMIADGESVEIPFEALDQNGEKITNFATLAKQTTFNKLSFTTSGPAGSYVKLSEKADGTAKLVYTDAPMTWDKSEATDGIDRTVSITSVVVGGDTSNQLLYIQDKARPDAISTVDMDNVLVEKGSDKVTLSNFDFLDQYGRKMAGVTGYKSAVTDGNTSNKNEGYVYDNGFFAASKARLLKGTDFAGYDYIVRATFKGDAGYLNDGATPLVPDAIVEVSNAEALDLSANEKVVESAKSGFSVKYEIARTKTTLAEAQATSTAKSEAVTIVDIKAVTGYTVGDLNKFYIATDKTNDVTGDTGATIALDNSAVVSKGINAELVAGDLVGDALTLTEGYEQTVSVKGTYNGETVKIPAIYFTVEAAKLADTNGDGKVDSAKLGDATNALKWSDFYDATSARYVRKDASDTIKVTVRDIEKQTAETPKVVIDTISKAVAIADAAPKAASITGVDSVTVSGTNTVIAKPAYAEGVITFGSNDFEIKDQYGVTIDVAPTFKVASIVANPAGYADNNFVVSGNDTINVTVTGAERADSYVLTLRVGNVTKEVKVTVGADVNANIKDAVNNYLNELVDKALEPQRQAGLN